jgi:hypothetical protein
MICEKVLSNGVTSTWSEIVRTEMDYNGKSSRATVYYYLDEKAFTDGKESVYGEIIDVPYVEEEELKKVNVTSKTVAETAMSAKLEAVPNEEPIEP